MASRKILILFAHPALEKSRVNRVLIEEAFKLDGITVHDLYEAYPNFDIDVSREQELLVANDVIVLHHPFFWYSTPAILKEWQDLVLTHGWAYGTGGDKLRGKLMLNALTTGGREHAYCREGYNMYSVRELLTPIAQTAHLCGVDYIAPFVAHGALHMSETDISNHAVDYRRTLEALRDGTMDIEKAHDATRLNADLSSLITQPGEV